MTATKTAERLNEQMEWLGREARTLEAKAFAGRASQQDLDTASFLRGWQEELEQQFDAALGEPLEEPGRPDEPYPSPQQLADELGVELPW